MMFGGDKPWKNHKAAMPDDEVMKAALEIDATHLHDTKASPLRTVVNRQLLKQDDAMSDRVEL
jgi:hypothetical protein